MALEKPGKLGNFFLLPCGRTGKQLLFFSFFDDVDDDDDIFTVCVYVSLLGLCWTERHAAWRQETCGAAGKCRQNSWQRTLCSML